jgi:Na+(H+)/acetate symporter ActP
MDERKRVLIGFNPLALFQAASEQYGEAVLAPGKQASDPLDTISLGMSLIFGTAGLPHILLRFYPVSNVKATCNPLMYATLFIGYFPTFLLSMLWWRFTIKGAVASIVVGSVSSLGLIYFSPIVQVTQCAT